MTMLSEQERQLLYWLTSTHFIGAGAIVDGGCFVGGSTLSLAEGLRKNAARSSSARVHVFDLFEVEPYMADLYFSERGLAPGDSFRTLFDGKHQVGQRPALGDGWRPREGELG